MVRSFFLKMCGILCILHSTSNNGIDCTETGILQKQQLEISLCRRGPDINSTTCTIGSIWSLEMTGYTLWLQGDQPVKQPLITDDELVQLLWNGDIFGGIDIPDKSNDGEVLLKKLQTCDSPMEISTVLAKIEGPWSAIVFHKPSNSLIFGRDVLGRHSLLWGLHESGLVISSVGSKSSGLKFNEIPTVGLFRIEISDNLVTPFDQMTLTVYPWNHIEDHQIPDWPGVISFSSTLTPPINCASQHSVPREMQLHDGRLKHCDNAKDCLDYLKSLKVSILHESCERLMKALDSSIRKRVRIHPNRCTKCTYNEDSCVHTKVAVMFSGGVDSTVLALIANQHIPCHEVIDLYNVAFDSEGNGTSSFNVPDRILGRKSLEDLILLCPLRKWNFIEIDINSNELEKDRTQHISSLVLPCQTVLDESLGCVLWFAARGIGNIMTVDGNKEFYVSHARVVLGGQGADEQLCGYVSHLNCFKHGGWEGVAVEIQRQLQNISHRNLGRDNRVVQDHGRVLRVPFLDEEVVRTLQSIPIPHILCPDLPRGVGEKLVLRVLAASMGLDNAAISPKKAMQFGTRFVHMERKKGGKKKGSDIMIR